MNVKWTSLKFQAESTLEAELRSFTAFRMTVSEGVRLTKAKSSQSHLMLHAVMGDFVASTTIADLALPVLTLFRSLVFDLWTFLLASCS